MKIRKVIIALLLVAGIIGTNIYDVRNIYASAEDTRITTSKEHIEVKIISVSKKQIKIKIKNNGEQDFWFSELFSLKKRQNGKWKKVKFSDDALFRKTITVEGGKSITVKLKWKRFFDKKLSKGKYKIKFIRSKTFKIK